MASLQAAKMTSVQRVAMATPQRLAKLIKPVGFFNVKVSDSKPLRYLPKKKQIGIEKDILWETLPCGMIMLVRYVLLDAGCLLDVFPRKLGEDDQILTNQLIN